MFNRDSMTRGVGLSRQSRSNCLSTFVFAFVFVFVIAFVADLTGIAGERLGIAGDCARPGNLGWGVANVVPTWLVWEGP